MRHAICYVLIFLLGFTLGFAGLRMWTPSFWAINILVSLIFAIAIWPVRAKYKQAWPVVAPARAARDLTAEIIVGLGAIEHTFLKWNDPKLEIKLFAYNLAPEVIAKVMAADHMQPLYIYCRVGHSLKPAISILPDLLGKPHV